MNSTAQTQTATKPAHTPTPWTRYNDTTSTGRIEIVGVGKTIARIYCSNRHEDLANAALIVRAVNSHAELVAALENIAGLWADSDQTNGLAQIMAREARAALAKAQA